MKSGNNATGTVAVLAGAAGAALAAFALYAIGIWIAENWVHPGRPVPRDGGAEFVVAYAAFLLGLPGGLLGWLDRRRRGWHRWIVIPVLSAAVYGLPCVAMCVGTQTPLLEPLSLFLVFGLAAVGFFSALTSRVVAVRSLERAGADDRTRQDASNSRCDS